VSGGRSYYQILMVDQSVDQDILAVVHRRLAQRFHPDVDPSDEARQRMMEINRAYDTLRDPDRRAKYDRELATRRDRRASDRYARRPVQPSPAEDPATAQARPAAASSASGEAGPPPRGIARGTVLDFGRYKGWSIGQIATHDPDFLEWLQRSPSGRQFRAEIATYLSRLGR
jgi:curved DNA-binding protein CbpA